MSEHEPADHPYQALHDASEQRRIEAAGPNRKLAAAALMRLGPECPPECEEIGTEVILHSEYNWSQIADRLGVTRGQAVHRFQRLLATAGVGGAKTD